MPLLKTAAALWRKMTAVGKIKLFTELPPYSSCSSVIAQFAKKYPNIIIEVIENGGTKLLP